MCFFYTGRRNESNGQYMVPDFGEKFIGVENQGVLQIHGERKLSWTKLEGTIYPPTYLLDALVSYKHPLYSNRNLPLRYRQSCLQGYTRFGGYSSQSFFRRSAKPDEKPKGQNELVRPCSRL